MPSSGEAQFGRRLKDAVKRTAEDKAISKATEEESKAIDGALSGGAEGAPADLAAAATPAGSEPAAQAAPAAAPGKALPEYPVHRVRTSGSARTPASPGRRSSPPASPEPTGTSLYKVRVMADGKYAKVYINERRVANAPNADLGRPTKLILNLHGWDKEPTLIGNIHVAAGGKRLYDALAETGRGATQGIYFDTGSDRLRPESSATLREIGAMLKEHPDLKLTIEGHIDNVGSAGSNLALSEKRAAAVRQFLLETYQVDGARLSATGLGQSKPAGSNDTPEGRQANRRVELVKM